MPWKEASIMDERKEFIFRTWRSTETFTETCRKFGISTKTGYKWLERFKEKGAAGLVDESRARKNVQNKTNPEIQNRLLKIKEKHKAWGAKKIMVIYMKKYPSEYIPARSTVEELFKREGYTKKKRRQRTKQTQIIQERIKPTKPNELWTVDFKGWWWTSKNERCEPLTVRDEFTRNILAIEVPEKGNTPHVKAEFERIFKKYGLPDYIRSDNGPPFGNVLNMWGLTKLSVWWISLGIKLDRSDPGHPEQNGAHERMHRDMMKELENKIEGDLRLHQKMFDRWRKEFNEVRPHEALGMKTPSELYVKSQRPYPGMDVDVEYNGRMKSRIVNDRGFFNYKQNRIFVGNPFSGYNVGLQENKNGRIEVWFDYLKLGEINPDTLQIEPEGCIIQKKIS
jgi:transposase InsO family protein